MAGAVAAGCGPAPVVEPPPPPPCASVDGVNGHEVIDGDVAVFLDVPDDVDGAALRADVARVLGAMWGDRWAFVDEPSDGASVVVRLDDGAPADGYALARDGDVLRVAARGRRDLAHGAYALLEVLGARFFHPKHELLPSLGGPRFPATLDVRASSPYRLRGTQLHTLHPLEYNRALLYDDPDDLADALLVVDWLVKTGQNHLQWFLLNTVPTDEWQARATAIADYAHARGVTVAAVAQLWEGASLQNAYSLVVDDAEGFDAMEARIDEVMSVPFDGIELGMGEFLATDATAMLGWLNHATAYMATTYPAATLSVVNHVGNYPELQVELNGAPVFYYHLPGHADPRLVNTVHTVYWYDLYRPQGAYAHEDFSEQREFLFGELGERAVRYMPESAYWVSADIDVPAFLPQYVQSRHTDIQGLARDVVERGLPPLDGHVMYSSGHEWGYWMTDYLAARMLWTPSLPLSSYWDVVARPFGACAGDVERALADFTALQERVLFDGELIPYVAAEDLHDDLGAAADFVTIPARVPFHELRGWEDDARADFRRDVVDALREAVVEGEAIEARLAARCARADDLLRPWCDEFVDGVAVTTLRMDHSAHLYEAVLDAIAGEGDPDASLAAAAAITDVAADVIARREQGYRFDRDLLTGAYENETRYEFGLYRQPSTQCLWRRQEQQVAFFLENGEGASPFELPTCQD